MPPDLIESSKFGIAGDQEIEDVLKREVLNLPLRTSLRCQRASGGAAAKE
jgi:hypothetical protein